MAARMLPSGDDPIRPLDAESVTITVNGEEITGIAGQSIAGLMMSADRLEFRTTLRRGRPRGVFCGIGVCFDCLVEVNGLRDVRACQRRARGGDVVVTRVEPELPGGGS